MTPHPAAARQILAADPAASTWLSANAGSGKTRVLTDRVSRLLIEGTEPQRILCLTYTKAAAAEMQNRLFDQLGKWAMLGDGDLHAALEGLGVEVGASAAGSERLAEARRLFARAIETPGGLRIQTIHAFCAGLLRRFPLEAGVSPLFAEADDRAMDLLRAEIVEAMASGPEAALVDALAMDLTAQDFGAITHQIARHRGRFAEGLDLAAALRHLGVAPDLTEARVLATAFCGDEAAMLRAAVAAMAEGSTNDRKAATALGAVLGGMDAPGMAELCALEDVLLTGASAQEPFAPKVGSLPTRALREGRPDLFAPLADLMRRVAEARRLRIALRSAARSVALHAFARAFLGHLAENKARRGWLDFDDLIEGAARLIETSPMAQWVLYRLDGGIDHILIDEAQDTAPQQWRVIARLTEEMTAGSGARDGAARTLFVVGDKKQSIYSFQGADLAAFDRMQRAFARQMAPSETPLRELTLDHSFRSSEAILRAVDATFAAEGAANLGDATRHEAFHDALPGRVDLWPPLAAAPKTEAEHWTDPVDRPRATDPEAVLARTIARHLRELIAAGTQIPTAKGPRALHEGDVLILLRRRKRLFGELIAACKAEGLAVAGPDRLQLGAEIAVRDLTALLSFVATPADELSLAVALRSPLFGWDEGRLYDLAQGRRGDLWSALRRDPGAAEARAVLEDLRDSADFLRPFELLDRVLTRHDGRRRLLGRLGPEAEDGIDQLLAQALAFERASVPSLTGFLDWIEDEDFEVRRQTDAAERRIRVMTVHGAKGLEAPLVILPDCGRHQNNDRDEIVLPEGTPPLRRAAVKSERPALLEDAVAQAQERAEAERLRLLYVAMTRASAWLVVAAPGEAKGPPDWHALVAEGLGRAGAQPCAMPTGEGLRLSAGEWPDPAPAGAAADGAVGRADLPDWVGAGVAREDRAPDWITPTSRGGAKGLAEAEADPAESAAAMAYGSALHLLLEHLPDLPEGDRAAAAARLVPDPALREPALAQAAGLIAAAHLGAVFRPGPGAQVLREVALSAPGPDAAAGGAPLMGIIDRLILTDARALAIDYKTNRLVPADAAAVPEGLMRQMAAYRHALRAILPGRAVDVAILWTANGTLMTLDPAALDLAGAAVGLGTGSGDLDAGGGDP
ncbi:MAG: double-strand break repair helicase AddA [Gemmobacter sp.]